MLVNSVLLEAALLLGTPASADGAELGWDYFWWG